MKMTSAAARARGAAKAPSVQQALGELVDLCRVRLFRENSV
ncbi:MAG: hypothetical protein ACRDR6_01170 [Pseudonocardiaceae bacterium]